MFSARSELEAAALLGRVGDRIRADVAMRVGIGCCYLISRERRGPRLAARNPLIRSGAWRWALLHIIRPSDVEKGWVV